MLMLGPGLGAGQSVALDKSEASLSGHDFALQAPTFHSRSDLVLLAVTIEDSAGNAVTDLSKSQFEITDRGQPQTILSFEPPTLPPARKPAPPAPGRTAARSAPPTASAGAMLFFFDDLHSDAVALTRAVASLRSSLPGSSLAGNRIAVATASGTVRAPFQGVEGALQAMRSIRSHKAQDGISCPYISPEQAYRIISRSDPQAFDLAVAQFCACSDRDKEACGNMASLEVQSLAANVWRQSAFRTEQTLDVLRGAVDALAQRPGQRTLILVSSGFLTPSLQQRLDAVVTVALRSRVVISSLDPAGLRPDDQLAGSASNNPLVNTASLDAHRPQLTSAGESDAAAPLRQLADGTGGEFFHHNNDLARGFARITAGDRAYHITYAPTGLTADGAYHSVRVRVSGRTGLHIESRPGYFAPAPADRLSPQSELARLRREAVASDRLAELPAELHIRESGPRRHGLNLTISLPIAGLALRKVHGRHHDQINFVSMLTNPKGKIILSHEGMMALNLTDHSLKALKVLSVDQPIQVPAGRYHLRELVQDAGQDHISTFDHEVSVP